jgi:hypothetical protein
MHETVRAALLDAATTQPLLEAATAAPSVHNSQPWQFEVGERSIDLYADVGRQLTFADAGGRSLLISCGAALFNLRVAADHLGFHPRVRLMPTPTDLTHVARLEVDHRHDRPGLMSDLYPAIWVRRTNRYPFWERRVPRGLLSRMQEAVTLENAILRVYDDQAEVDRIVGLLHDAERQERTDEQKSAERREWIGRTAPGEGVPRQSLGPRPKDHVEAERVVAATMLADLPTIEPHIRVPIDGAEVQQDTLIAPSSGRTERAAVPSLLFRQ